MLVAFPNSPFKLNQAFLPAGDQPEAPGDWVGGDGLEVVEVRRIPNTTDVLALYEIDADDKGNLQGYRRIRRYARGALTGWPRKPGG